MPQSRLRYMCLGSSVTQQDTLRYCLRLMCSVRVLNEVMCHTSDNYTRFVVNCHNSHNRHHGCVWGLCVTEQATLQVLGSCVTSAAYDGRPETLVTVATELGEPIDLIRLLQMSWEDRLRVTIVEPILPLSTDYSSDTHAFSQAG